MKSSFPGFPPEGIEFFGKLMRNNRREWFQPRKHIYEEQLRKPMLELVQALNGAMKSFAPDYITEPEKAVFRIYRDTRFSKDKTPYKDHVAANFYRRDSAGHGTGGFYIAVSTQSVAIGGGVYTVEPDRLFAIREHIAANHEQLRKIMRAKKLRELCGEMQGETLSRVPKGFAPTHPAADLLRHKRFIYYVELPAALAVSGEIYPEIVQRFRAMMPFLNFMEAAKPRKKQSISYF